MCLNKHMLGIIFLHGKHAGPSNPECSTAKLYNLFKSRFGDKFLYTYKDYPWSYSRNFDLGTAETIEEIHSDVCAIKDRGASCVVLIGHSCGGNGTVQYLSKYKEDVKNVILLAPAHNPFSEYAYSCTKNCLNDAKNELKNGSNEPSPRIVFNWGEAYIKWMPPGIYVDWFDPEGRANMAKTVKKIDQSLNVFMATGADTPHDHKAKMFLYNRLRKTGKSQYHIIPDANHKTVVGASFPLIVQWLASLQANKQLKG